MEKIIPRWEYRTFAEELDAVARNLAAHEQTRVLDSEEDYIVCSSSGHNVKIRNGVLDIKQLQSVNEDGLEQWMPVLKVGFPCPAADVGRVFSTYGLAHPAMSRDEYTYGEFIDEIVGGTPELEIVKVTKRRYGYMIRDVIVELADVTFNGAPLRTAAAEHIDPALVMEIAHEIGLDTYPNINYIRAMKRAVGMESA